MSITCRNCGRELTAQQAGEPCPNCGSFDRNLSAQEQAVATEKANVAKELARMHFQIEPGLTRVFRCSGSADIEFRRNEPIKLLEVNVGTVASGIMPLRFGPLPASGINYPSVIIEVTPDEFERIESKKEKLPEGWQIRDDLPKPNGA